MEFARSLLDPLLGNEPVGGFCLAGGAFKSLLHGRSPRDLDLWPATEADRESLAAYLMERGARLERDNPPFQSLYTCAGRRLDLAYDTTAPTLEERLGRFDLSISAMGVEHRGGVWRGMVHPLAIESIARREVLLLKPLTNWKYALATLGRLHRYGVELGFSVPPEEEEAIWDLFALQSLDEQQAMVARYLRVASGDSRLLEEVRSRMHRA